MNKNISGPLATATAHAAGTGTGTAPVTAATTAIPAADAARRQGPGRAVRIRTAQAIQGARAARAAQATAKAQAIARAHARALQRRAATMIGSDTGPETASALFTGVDGGGGAGSSRAPMTPEYGHASQARAYSV